MGKGSWTSLCLLGPESRFGDKLLLFRVFCPHIWECGSKRVNVNYNYLNNYAFLPCNGNMLVVLDSDGNDGAQRDLRDHVGFSMPRPASAISCGTDGTRPKPAGEIACIPYRVKSGQTDFVFPNSENKWWACSFLRTQHALSLILPHQQLPCCWVPTINNYYF